MPTPRPYGGVSAVERTAVRRASLLESCRTVIGRDGVAGVTVEAVCAEAALGKRYFYESFSARDDLLLAVADEFYTGLLDAMRATIGPLGAEDRPRAVVKKLVEALSHDERMARLYVESPGTPVLAARRHRAIDDYSAFVADEVFPTAAGTRRARAQRTLATRLLVAGTTDLVAGWLAGEVSASSKDVVEAIALMGSPLAESSL